MSLKKGRHGAATRNRTRNKVRTTERTHIYTEMRFSYVVKSRRSRSLPKVAARLGVPVPVVNVVGGVVVVVEARAAVAAVIIVSVVERRNAERTV